MTANGHISLSVVICTKDKPDALKRCLASVARSLSGLQAAEVIVVDNARKPCSAARQAAETSGARYLWEGLRGVSAARNRGILESHGALVAFLDDDVTVCHDWVSKARVHFRDPDVVAVAGLVVAPADTTATGALWYALYRFYSKTFTRFTASSPLPFFPLTAGVCGLGANVVFRRSFFFRHGLFDPKLGAGSLAPGSEDIDRFFVALRQGGAILFDPGMSVEHTFTDTALRFFFKVFGYAAGQSAYLAKWFVRDKTARLLVVAFVRHRIKAFLRTKDRASDKFSSIHAPRLPLLLGTLWGPVGYTLSCLREAFAPNKTVQVPGVDREASRKPRVLVSVYNAGLTGLEKVALLGARGVADQASVVMIFPCAGPPAEEAIALGLRVGFVPRWRLRATLNPFYQVAYLLALPGGVGAFARAIRSISADLIHIHSLVSLAALVAGRLSPAKVLLHVHEIALGKLGAGLKRLAASCSDRILAVSEAVAKTFPTDVQREKTHVVYGAVDAQRLRTLARASGEQPGEWILFAARLSRDKGPDLFLRAAQLTFDAEPGASFILCGLTVPNRSAYERRLQELLSTLTIPASQLQIERDREDIEGFLQRSAIVVNSSLQPDPFPVAILEGMALGKAVVAPAIGGLPEMIRHEETGLLYPPGDAHALSRALVRLLHDRELAARLGAAARARVDSAFDAPILERALRWQYLQMLD